MASPNSPPFSETSKEALSLGLPTLVDYEEPGWSWVANGRPASQISDSYSPPNLELKGQPPESTSGTLAVKHMIGDSAIDGINVMGNTIDDTFRYLSPVRKKVLLAIFSLAIALDVISVSGLLTATESISQDLGLTAGNVVWVLTAYAMTFVSFLLLAGRLADLYPPQFIFEGGFVTLAIFLLVSSFVSNKYGFLVLRALQGISAAMTVPTAYHIIVHLFPEKDRQQNALAMLGLVAAISNTLGVVLGGLFTLASWVWLFRFMAILAFLSAGVGALLLPWETGRQTAPSKFSKLQRLDLVGVFLMTSALLLFVLGLTSGTIDGWTDVHFLAPFLISAFLFPAVFIWESNLDEEKALLPMRLLKLPNLVLLCFMAMTPYLWLGTVSLGLVNYYQVVLHQSAVLAAARVLPIGIAGFIGGMLPQFFPILLSRPKWTVIGATFITIVPASVLLILGDGGHGNDYWKYMFTGCAIGSFGMCLTFLALNIGIIQAVPPSASGVAGAVLQVSLQIGSVVGLSVQAGLYSIVDNDLFNWKGTQYGFYFDIAWLSVSLIVFIIFYRPEASRKILSELKGKEQAVNGDITSSNVFPA